MTSPPSGSPTNPGLSRSAAAASGEALTWQTHQSRKCRLRPTPPSRSATPLGMSLRRPHTSPPPAPLPSKPGSPLRHLLPHHHYPKHPRGPRCMLRGTLRRARRTPRLPPPQLRRHRHMPWPMQQRRRLRRRCGLSLSNTARRRRPHVARPPWCRRRSSRGASAPPSAPPWPSGPSPAGRRPFAAWAQHAARPQPATPLSAD